MNSKYPNGVIPHKTPLGTTYEKWYLAYHDQLIEMYILVCDIISSYMPNHVQSLENHNTFQGFCKMIYRSSSKYITPY